MAQDGGPEFVYVRSGFDNNRVALHEIDVAHPGGSVIVSRDMGAIKVGNTALVRQRLRDQWLVEADSADDKKHADTFAKDRMEMLSAQGDRGAEVVGEQFSDTREWPGVNPTPEEVMRDENPKLAEAMYEAEVKVPEPPKGDETATVKAQDKPGRQPR